MEKIVLGFINLSGSIEERCNKLQHILDTANSPKMATILLDTLILFKSANFKVMS